MLESNQAGTYLKLNFDIKTGLLLSTLIEKKTLEGFDRKVYEYKNYQVVDGIKTAFTRSTLHIGTNVKTSNFVIKYKTVKFNVPINDFSFKKPIRLLADLLFLWESRGKVGVKP